MDTLGGLAFAGEYPQRHYLKERPLKREEPILTGGMLWQILLMGGYGTAMCSCFLGNRHIRSFLGYNSAANRFLCALYIYGDRHLLHSQKRAGKPAVRSWEKQTVPLDHDGYYRHSDADAVFRG